MEQNTPSFTYYVIDLMKNNLKNWNIYYYLFFFILIPLINIIIYLIPGEVKTNFFIFHTSQLFQFQTYILSSYTHFEFYSHLIGNLVIYLIAIFVIFAFENKRDRFNKIAILALIIVPIIISIFTAAFWQIIGKDMNSFGFSGIVATFFSYAFVIALIGILGDSLETLDHKEMYEGRIWVYYLVSILLAVIFALVLVVGQIMGQFLLSGNSVSNGLAHFLGYVLGLIAFLIIDIFQEKRKYVDILIAFSIVLAIINYYVYLSKLM